MIDFCDRDVSIIIKSDIGFSALKVWDIMISLDLAFVPDSGVFEFQENEEDDEEFIPSFTVATNREPRKLSPVFMSNPNNKIFDLNFQCFVPHLPDPLRSIKLMEKAAIYTQSKLGGIIVNELEKPFKYEELVEEVEQVIKTMKICEITPGSLYSVELF